MRGTARLLRLSPALACVALAGATAAPAAAQDDDGGRCAGTFHVPYETRVAEMRIPAATYVVAAGDDVTCSRATELLGSFLPRWNGALPDSWRAVPDERGFARNGSDTERFRLVAAEAPSSKGTVPPGGSCPYMTLVRARELGRLSLPAGRYRMGLLTRRGLTCTQAVRQLFAFLGVEDGVFLPWAIRIERAGAASFRDTTTGAGFSLRRAYAGTDGGGSYPALGQDRCSGPFNVRNDDPVGKDLLVRRGPYGVTTFGGVTCEDAVTALQLFLTRPEGDLPAPWRLAPASAAFTRGTAGRKGFRIAPAYE